MSFRRILLIAIPVVALSSGVAWQVKNRVAPPPTTPAPVEVAAVTRNPQVIAVDNVFNFGVMNPGEKRTRTFIIKNQGDADLKLALEKTTCKCTLAHVDGEVVPPGGSTEIELEWHAEEPQFRFRQAAVIKTNDPTKPRFELAVEGSIRVKLAPLPEDVFFAEIPKNSGRTIEATVYSQAFDKVEIRSIESTLKSITVTLDEKTSVPEGPEGARYVRMLKIEKAPDDKPGSFEGVVKLNYVGSYRGGREEAGVWELPIAGDTAGDLTLHGKSVVGTVLNLGTVPQTVGVKQKAYIHVHGSAQAVTFAVTRTKPEFLKVDIGAGQRLSPSITRFPIEVTIPPGSPQVNLMYPETGQGEVVLQTTHADHPQIRFQVAMLISP